MADEDLRFDISAHDDGAIGTFQRVARAIDNLKDSMARSVQAARDSAVVSTQLTAARNREADAAGKLRVAEAALADLRGRSDVSSARVVMAEERVAKARRDAALVASRLAEAERKEFGSRAGQQSGQSFMSGLADWVQQHGYGVLQFLGGNGGRSFVAGLSEVLSTPVLGPIIIGAFAALAGTALVAVGATLADAVVLGFGSGLAGIGIAFALQTSVVKESWKNAIAGMGATMKDLSAPFDSTMLALVVSAKRAFGTLAPELGAAFKEMAPVVFAFGNQLAQSLAAAGQAIKPISQAFSAVLITLGPAVQEAIKSVAAGMIELSNSVRADPHALADFIDGIGTLAQDLLRFLTILNDANDSFTRFTGGVSAVDVIMGILRAGLYAVIGPIEITLKGLSALADGMNFLAGKLGIGTKVTNGVADSLRHAAAGMNSNAAATAGYTLAQDHANHVAHQANIDALNLANAYDRQTAATQALLDVTHRLADTIYNSKKTELDYYQAILDTSAGLKKNGRTLNENTQAGVDNWRNLLKIVDAAKQHFDAMVKQNASIQSQTAFVNTARNAFIQFAEKMHMSTGEAQALAKQLIVTQQQIDALHGKTIQIKYTTSGVLTTTGGSFVNGGQGGHLMAAGGQVAGPGSDTSDTAGLYALSNNEYVVRAKSAKKYGSRAMASVNAGTATVIPGMADGGPVIDINSDFPFASAAQLQSTLTRLAGASAPGAGAGVQRWAGVALAALAAAGEPSSWLGSLLSRMQRESGGNPNAINLTDSNAAAGDPSRGLMQTIGATFNAFAGAYASRGIYDPFANIYAAIRYTVGRYGSGPAGWDQPGGYRNGGWLMPGQLAYNETRKPEAVFNQEQLAAMSRPIQVNLVVDGKVLHQSLVKLNKDRRYRGLGLGPGEHG